MGEEKKFNLGDQVRIRVSGEEGQVIGKAEYLTSGPQCWVRYKAADGRATEAWWEVSALEAVRN